MEDRAKIRLVALTILPDVQCADVLDMIVALSEK
jgi:hypothetical protein